MAKQSNNNNKPNQRRSNGGSSSRNSRNNRETAADSRRDNLSRRTSPAIQNIIAASASIAVRNVGGNPVNVPMVKSVTGLSITDAKFTVPGVVRIGFNPVFGVARGSQTDPVNLAARNMWMNLRSLYSNRIPYTAGAIVMYSMALDGVLMAFQWLKRAYGVVFAYDARNRYVPDGLLLAMGIDPNDFRANLPVIKTFINKLATQLSAFGVPTELRFIMDHLDAVSHIYMDGISPTAQYLVLDPEFVWKMDWANNKLTAFSIAAGPQGGTVPSQAIVASTWAQISDHITTLVESFVNNEDVYMIASDMLRLYGNLATVGPVDSSYMVGPEYSEEFLECMHNATFVPIEQVVESTTASTQIWEVSELQAPENVGAITANYASGFDMPTLHTADRGTQVVAFMAVSPGIYDFHTGEPTMEQMVRASNWKFALEFVSNNTPAHYMARLKTVGTLMLSHISFITMIDETLSSNEVVRVFAAQSVHPTWDSTTSKVTYAIPSINAIQTWKDHPYLPLGTVSVTVTGTNKASVTASVTDFIGDVDQYVTLDVDEISRIHEAIILDKFDAAGTGTLNLHAK